MDLNIFIIIMIIMQHVAWNVLNLLNDVMRCVMIMRHWNVLNLLNDVS